MKINNQRLCAFKQKLFTKKTKSEYIKAAVGCAAVLFLLLVGGNLAGRRLTYIESVTMNDKAEMTVAVTDNQTVLEQEFRMPYGLFSQIAIKVGTYGRNNNSFWDVTLREKESGKEIYDWYFNASQAADGLDYPLPATFPVRVEKGESYVLSIRSRDSTGYSALAFYTSENDAYEEGALYQNGKKLEGDLCFQVYGGEKDGFWTGIYVFFSLALCGLAAYALWKRQKGEKLCEDRLFLAAVTAALFLILTYIFSRTNMGDFTDECDNIRGGMLIARGKVLYRDYYAQHTPFVYFLCSLFALLGAGSVQQFRLLYYIVLAGAWAFLYYRHCDFFGRVKMFLLPIAETVIIMPMQFQASKIMGDNIQGLCMVALTLEFLRYLEDRALTTYRCIIVALCLYMSVMSAFVSVFALAPVLAGVVVWEVRYWREEKGFGIKSAAARYWKPVAFTALPFAATVVYFIGVRAMREFYLMAYQFNTLVYKSYQNEFGRVKWKPFVLGIKNYFMSISYYLEELIKMVPGDNATAESRILPLLLASLSGVVLVMWGLGEKKGKRIFPALCLFLCITGNMTRESTGFHALPAWNVALALILLLGGGLTAGFRQNYAATAAGILLAGYCMQPYITLVADHIVYRQPAVEGIDKAVVELTEPGEGIFIDCLIHDSIYLMEKDRIPVNRNCYILPWYMDWFEHDTIEDLEKYRPRIAVYDPATHINGPENFCPNLTQAIQTRYTRESEESFLWKLKEDRY